MSESSSNDFQASGLNQKNLPLDSLELEAYIVEFVADLILSDHGFGKLSWLQTLGGRVCHIFSESFFILPKDLFCSINYKTQIENENGSNFEFILI